MLERGQKYETPYEIRPQSALPAGQVDLRAAHDDRSALSLDARTVILHHFLGWSLRPLFLIASWAMNELLYVVFVCFGTTDFQVVERGVW